MAVSHVKSDTGADFTGTFTGFNSQGSTTTIAAVDVVRPSDWNSAHNQFYTVTGNTTNNSTASGTNVIFSGGQLVSLGGNTVSLKFDAGHSGRTFWQNMGTWQTRVLISNLTALSARPIFFPIQLDHAITFNAMQFDVSRSTSNSNLFTMHAAIYSFVNSTQISRLASAVNSVSQTATASLTGLRLLQVSGFETAGTVLSAGEYMGMFWISAAATASMNYSIRGLATANPPVGILGGGTDQYTTATTALSSRPLYNMWGGLYTTTTASPPGSVAYSNLSHWTAGWVPAVNLVST